MPPPNRVRWPQDQLLIVLNPYHKLGQRQETIGYGPSKEEMGGVESRLAGKLTTDLALAKVPPSSPLRLKSLLQMKPPKSINLKSRAAEKMASRREDRVRLENGESPEIIQRENSIFPPGYFKKHRIINFASAIGK